LAGQPSDECDTNELDAPGADVEHAEYMAAIANTTTPATVRAPLERRAATSCTPI
jgi:hypothetical protein